MPLLYKPIYNPDLDLAFGRTRNGKQRNRFTFNPMRYGLTQSQVDELKEAGQWESFTQLWGEKRKRYMARRGHACYLCGSNRRNGVTILRRNICKDCCDNIKGIVYDRNRGK